MRRRQVRAGAYYDSIVLMQLQSALLQLPGVRDSGVVMATAANLALLRDNGLLAADGDGGARTAESDTGDLSAADLLIVVEAESAEAADAALARIDELLARRTRTATDEYRPKSLAAALAALPEARWVLVSVPGRYAARVAEDALALGRHVFLYSDNVPLAAEVALKRRAVAQGLLVMGPDCGTAVVAGVGLGFANRVRRGAVGVVAASGTGAQAVMSRLHELGAGVSHVIGTGGRDLTAEVGAATARQGLALLARDPETRVIVLVSKPPAPQVAAALLAAARATGKPVVVDFLGYPPPARQLDNLRFAAGLSEAAETAAALLDAGDVDVSAPASAAGHLRGLFSGGTLALETLQGVRPFLTPLAANFAFPDVARLADPAQSTGHAVLDLGADELTVGRVHPMIDPDLCRRRLLREAADPSVAVILLDVVLGYGANPDPAAVLAPAIAEAKAQRGALEIAAVVIGTDEDPQGIDGQVEQLRRAGARTFRTVASAVEWVVRRLAPADAGELPAVDAAALAPPLAAVNVGLESFYDSLRAQEAHAVDVDWRPPAGGDERLQAILQKMRRGAS